MYGGSVLVIGDVMTDIVVQSEGPVAIGGDRRATIRVLPGGSGANQAAWLASESIPTMFAGRVGRADHERQSQELSAHVVEPRLAADESLPTGTIVTLLSADGERSFLTDRGANDCLSRTDLPHTLLDGVKLLHVSGYALVGEMPRAAIRDLMAEGLRREIAVSVDPPSYPFLRELGADNFLAWTKGATFCFPNAVEAATLTGTDDTEQQLAILSRCYQTVVIKRGEEGAVAAVAGDTRRWSVPAPAVEAIDSTGAGDAFLAGFLAAHLRGEGIEAGLRRGVAAGARAVTKLGGRPPVGGAAAPAPGSS